MSKFTTALLVSPLSDGKSWVLIGDFKYDIGFEGSNNSINVPDGFVTDFTSVPRIFWWMIPTWGKYGNAAVLHDWLYWQQDNTTDRKKSDEIFLEAMKVLKVGKLKRIVIFYAVRCFGSLAWFRNKGNREGGIDRVIKTKKIKTSLSFNRPTVTMLLTSRFLKEFKGKLNIKK